MTTKISIVGFGWNGGLVLCLLLSLLAAAPNSSRAFQSPAAIMSNMKARQQPAVLAGGAPYYYSSNSRTRLSAASKTAFELTIDLPPSGSDVQAFMGIDPIFSVPSELVVVRYKVPFGLSVEPQKNLAVVTKAGPGGEQPGDVLRYSSQWTLGLPKGDGLVTTAAAFSGGLSWQCSMFNVVKAKAWEQVVEALTSNTEARTDEVVMIFERALDGVTPPELQ